MLDKFNWVLREAFFLVPRGGAPNLWEVNFAASFTTVGFGLNFFG